MTAEQLRELQAPLKAHYREDPASAEVTLRARGTLHMDAMTCRLDRRKDNVEVGLHPAAGGNGIAACSGDMLLEALVACAGVTLCSVATALNVPIASGAVLAEGVLDFRGTLAVSKDAPVGFRAIRLHFDLRTQASGEKLNKLIELTERYCVVYQTLRQTPVFQVTYNAPTQE